MEFPWVGGWGEGRMGSHVKEDQEDTCISTE